MMLTVLMAVYAGESPEAFTAAFESLVRQTTAPAEIVLVEDGPLTLELRQVVEQFYGRLPLNVLALPTQMGLASALNVGLKAAKHPWVMRFDSDDICAPDRVEAQQHFMKRNDLDLFGGQIAEFQGDPSKFVRTRRVPLNHDEIRRFARQRNPFNHMTVCFRKSMALDCGGYPNLPHMEDYALWLKMISAGARTGNSDRTLVYARIGNGFIKRRGGLRYVRSEWHLQRLMHRLQLKPAWRAVADGLARSLVFVCPSVMRELVYRYALRRRIV